MSIVIISFFIIFIFLFITLIDIFSDIKIILKCMLNEEISRKKLKWMTSTDYFKDDKYD